MRIYPGKHVPVFKDNVDIENDIQLAYIQNNDHNLVFSLQSDHNDSYFEPIVPYTEFDKLIDIYNANKQRIIDERINLLNSTDKRTYMYIPQYTTIFAPEEFYYQIICKRNASYNALQNYNINVKCLNETYSDQENDYSLINELIKIFADAPERGLCPSNIAINNGDLSPLSLIDNGAINLIDIGIIKSKDGINYDNGENNLPILDDPLFNRYLNLIIVVPDNSFPTQNNTARIYHISDNNISYKLNSKLYNDLNITNDLPLFDIKEYIHQNPGNEYVNLTNTEYSPCLVKNDSNHYRRIIYVPASLFSNVNNNVNIIYELLMSLYLTSYIKSEEVNQWITDTIPDYIVSNHKMTKASKFLSKETYYDIVNCHKNDIIYVTTLTSQENVITENVLYDDKISFRKLVSGDYAKYKDPEKPANHISIYCHNKSIIYYKDNVFSYKTRFSDCCSISVINDILNIEINNYVDSINCIYIEHFKDQVSIINRSIGNIIISYQANNVFINKQSEYNSEQHGTILGIVNIDYGNADDKILYDIRLRGGGLPEYLKEDSRSLFDIGNINGLPYRKGGSVIIKLPAVMQKHDSIIQAAVKKHIAADEFPFIIYI